MFNGISLPTSIIRKAAIDAAYDAEQALRDGKRALRKANPSQTAAIHRTLRAKQDAARNLAEALKRRAS